MIAETRDRGALKKYLVAHRWLDAGHAHDERSVADAVRDAQRFLGGRESDSEAYTWDLLTSARCGFREPIVDGRTGLAKWSSNGPIKLYLTPGLPKLSMATWVSIVGEATARVMDVCGLVFVVVDDPRQANHIYRGVKLDGAGRVLADCELPYGVEQTRATVTRIDAGEDWGTSAAQRMISALDVVLHEGGHRDGISHVSASEDRCVMNPIYDPSLRATLQPRDVKEYTSRYGVRTPAPSNPTPLPDVPAGGDEVVIRVRGGRVPIITSVRGEHTIQAWGVPSIDGYLVSKRTGGR